MRRANKRPSRAVGGSGPHEDGERQRAAGTASAPTLKTAIARFWDAHPCGSDGARADPGSPGFFAEVEARRYREEFHIPHTAELDGHAGTRILELGGGLGTDGRRLARGARLYVDLDLSLHSLELARLGFRLEALDGSFVHGDAESLP